MISVRILFEKEKSSKVTGNNRILIVDLIKGVAILFVLLDHILSYIYDVRESYFIIFFINMAVPVFMVMSGYNYSLSSRKYSNVGQMYKPTVLLSKIRRYTLPYLCVYILYVILDVFHNGQQYSIGEIITSFIFGKWGPGAYYYILLLQMTVVCPILSLLIRKFRYKMVCLCGFINLLYGLFVQWCNLDSGICYRCVLGYLFCISLGMYMCEEKIRPITLSIMAAIGMGYLGIVKSGLEMPIFAQNKYTSMMVAFWIFPFLYLCIKWCKDIKHKFVIMEYIGKASFHIYCFQILWFKAHKGFYYLLNINSRFERAALSLVMCTMGGGIYVRN